MSDDAFGDPPEEPDPRFDFSGPRWRDDDDATREAERGRRYRGDVPPPQRGAIDEGGSVRRSEEADDTTDD